MKRIYNATRNSMRGLAFAAHSEPALRQEMGALVAALVIAPLAAPEPAWAVAMVGSILFIMAVELLNTAIEKIADHVTPEWHSAIGELKDIGSAGVFCALVLAALIWAAAIALRVGLL